MVALARKIAVFYILFSFLNLFSTCIHKRGNQNNTPDLYSQPDNIVSGPIENQQVEATVGSDAGVQTTYKLETHITKYYSRWKDFSDIGFLREMHNLKDVTIRGNSQLTDITPLASLPRLKRLYLSFCPNILSIEPLSNLVNLEYLLPSYEKPTDCAELQNLTKLKELHLNMTPITSVEYISHLTELENMSIIIPNETFDISQLRRLKKFKELILYGKKTRIDLNALKYLTNLEYLELLGFIDLDLQPLAHLPYLKHIDFYDSTVLDMMPLTDIEALDFFYLPLNFSDFSAVYHILRSRGVDWGSKYDR
jgi:hypothetical protein